MGVEVGAKVQVGRGVRVGVEVTVEVWVLVMVGVLVAEGVGFGKATALSRNAKKSNRKTAKSKAAIGRSGLRFVKLFNINNYYVKTTAKMSNAYPVRLKSRVAMIEGYPQAAVPGLLFKG